MESAAGEMIAAPTPWIARAAISVASDVASPQTSDAPEKSARPAMNIRRRPSRSALRPPSMSRPPKVSV